MHPEYNKYQKDITKIFYEEDPVHLRSSNEEEYLSEARSLIRNLVYLSDKEYETILELLYNIFGYTFNWGVADEDEDPIYYNVIGDKSNFESSAKRIYELLNRDAQ